MPCSTTPPLPVNVTSVVFVAVVAGAADAPEGTAATSSAVTNNASVISAVPIRFIVPSRGRCPSGTTLVGRASASQGAETPVRRGAGALFRPSTRGLPSPRATSPKSSR
ncbi:hypothetical protein GCM10020369_53670 [Cryptosporangium minutisporangium]|uniref:Secreted protein n=1 Tax=Cryptosporangium minutisporangium TaxID=113569 RepID=A0ABP6T3L5_9ACTN